MSYFANINSKNELQCIGLGLMDKDQYGSSNVQNIEVSAEVYYNAQQYGNNYYIYSNGEIVVNPNYEQEEAEKLKQIKIQEINEKISELEKLVTDEILFNHEENVQVYREVIQGLKNTRDNL